LKSVSLKLKPRLILREWSRIVNQILSILILDEFGKPKTTVKLQLSYDARAIDEEDVAKFLAILKKEIENVDEVSMGFSELRARNWN